MKFRKCILDTLSLCTNFACCRNMTSTSANTPVSSQIAGVFAEYSGCPQHRGAFDSHHESNFCFSDFVRSILLEVTLLCLVPCSIWLTCGLRRHHFPGTRTAGWVTRNTHTHVICFVWHCRGDPEPVLDRAGDRAALPRRARVAPLRRRQAQPRAERLAPRPAALRPVQPPNAARRRQPAGRCACVRGCAFQTQANARFLAHSPRGIVKHALHVVV